MVTKQILGYSVQTVTEVANGAANDTCSTAAAECAAHIERLPFSAWHIRLVLAVGIAHLLDAFDSLAIAMVLLVLIEIWHLAPSQLGLVLSIGYIGQMVGAIGFSWPSERFGRLRVLRLELGTMAVLSIATVFAGNYMTFMVLRFIQGLGLGGEYQSQPRWSTK
jgi:putative MFS transporter